jgi:hypothetical protein
MASRTNSAGEKPPTKCCKQKRYHQPDPGALTRVVRAVTRLGYAIDGQGDRRSSVHGPARSPWAGGDKVS